MTTHPDEEITEKHREQMNDLARALDRVFNGEKRGNDRDVGFVLLVFPFGEAGEDARCNYISNGADRKEIVSLMKEMIARFEGQPEIKPGHA